MPFVSKLFPKWHCKRLLRTDPLKALVIGGFVRGLSMRDVESLCEEAGLGKTSKSTVATDLRGAARAVRGVLSPLALRRQPGRAVPRRDLSAGPPERPEGGRDLRLGNHRERRTGSWFRCGWGRASPRRTGSSSAAISSARGLAAPRLVVADGAPGLISAVEEIWPRADRQHCAVHRLRNLLAKLPEVRARPDPLQLLVSAHRRDLGQGRQAPPPGPDLRARARAATSPPPAASPTTSTRSSCTCATRSDTANGGGQRTSSNARSARSAGAPK